MSVLISSAWLAGRWETSRSSTLTPNFAAYFGVQRVLGIKKGAGSTLLLAPGQSRTRVSVVLPKTQGRRFQPLPRATRPDPARYRPKRGHGGNRTEGHALHDRHAHHRALQTDVQSELKAAS